MTSNPMVDQSNARTTGHLLPSPIPPPTAPSSSSLRPPSGVSANSSRSSHLSEKSGAEQVDAIAVRKSHSHSVSSNPHTLASSKDTSKGSLSPDNRDRQ